MIFNKLKIFLANAKYVFVFIIVLNIAAVLIDILIGDGDGVISTLSFAPVLTYLYFGVILLLFISLHKVNILIFYQKLFQPISLKYLSIFRIIFAVVALLFFMQSYNFIEVINYNATILEIQLLKILYPYK